MIDLHDLEESWALLATSAPSGPEVRVRTIGMKVLRGDVLLGIDTSGNRHLLIPVPPTSTIRTDEKSSGVRVGRLKLEEEGAKRTFVDVTCSKPHLFDHFDIVVAEILHELETSTERPDQVAITVLERWRELLARERSSLPSINSLIGLFGELHLLRQLLTHHAGAVAWWMGPENGRHDFVTPRGAVEVKTTRANDDWAVTIHGFGQLESPAAGDLLLAVYKIEPHPSGRSIPDIVGEIAAGSGSSSDVLTKMMAWGLDGRDLPAIAPYTFELRKSRLYRVSVDFPKIVPDSFPDGKPPAGVRTLQYTIDLSSEPPTPLSEKDAAGALELLAGANT